MFFSVCLQRGKEAKITSCLEVLSGSFYDVIIEMGCTCILLASHSCCVDDDQRVFDQVFEDSL